MAVIAMLAFRCRETFRRLTPAWIASVASVCRRSCRRIFRRAATTNTRCMNTLTFSGASGASFRTLLRKSHRASVPLSAASTRRNSLTHSRIESPAGFDGLWKLEIRGIVRRGNAERTRPCHVIAGASTKDESPAWAPAFRLLWPNLTLGLRSESRCGDFLAP